MSTYAIMHPARLGFEYGPDGTMALVASARNGDKVMIAVSYDRWRELLRNPQPGDNAERTFADDFAEIPRRRWPSDG